MKNKIYAMTSNFSQVILPIVVFGGLGLGAIAWIDNLNHRTNLCNKVSFYSKFLIISSKTLRLSY